MFICFFPRSPFRIYLKARSAQRLIYELSSHIKGWFAPAYANCGPSKLYGLFSVALMSGYSEDVSWEASVKYNIALLVWFRNYLSIFIMLLLDVSAKQTQDLY